MGPLKRIHLWVPGLLGPGGIQQYSRTMLRALVELKPDTRLRVLSKNDCPKSLAPKDRVSYSASGRAPAGLRTAHFSALLLARAWVERPQLIIVTHLHFAPVAYALKRALGLRYWVAAHGLEARSLSATQSRALAKADNVLPVSRHTRNELRGVSLDPARCAVFPNAVDGDVFFPGAKPAHLLRRYGLRPEQKVIFTLARLDQGDRYKGFDRMLEAILLIQREIPDVHYLLAGRGADGDRLRERVRHLRLERSVTLTGFLPEADLRDHYNLCDLFALPSTGEGFGIVYLEALACGRPVLAGNQDGAGEPLLDGELGSLVDPSDIEALATRACSLLLGQARSPRHDPGHLRKRTLAAFGTGAFRERLRAALDA